VRCFARGAARDDETSSAVKATDRAGLSARGALGIFCLPLVPFSLHPLPSLPPFPLPSLSLSSFLGVPSHLALPPAPFPFLPVPSPNTATGSGAEPQPKLNFVHFSRKIWHVVRAIFNKNREKL